MLQCPRIGGHLPTNGVLSRTSIELAVLAPTVRHLPITTLGRADDDYFFSLIL